MGAKRILMSRTISATFEKFPIKENCNICETNKKLERHHYDYGYPECYTILCKKCHEHLHKLLKEKAYIVTLTPKFTYSKKNSHHKVPLNYKSNKIKPLRLCIGCKKYINKMDEHIPFENYHLHKKCFHYFKEKFGKEVFR